MYKYLFLLLLCSCGGAKKLSSLDYSNLSYGKGDSAIKAVITKVQSIDNGYELTLAVQENAPNLEGAGFIPKNQEIKALLYHNNLKRMEEKKEKAIIPKIKDGATILTTLRKNSRLRKYEIFDIEI